MATGAPVENKPLYVPDINELAARIEDGMAKNFKNISVTVADCPNLKEEPFCLAEEGLGGRPKILDVGGVPYLIPKPQLNKIYNFDKLAEIIAMKDAFFVGAGAGGCHILGTNSEMMANVKVGKHEQLGTKVASVKKGDDGCHLQDFPHKEFSLLGNFLACEGERSKVLKINASKRIGEENFVSCLRKVLHSNYGEDPVGLGGVFLIKNGKAKLHVMPDFSEVPLQSDKDVENWLKFYDVSSPLVCLSVLVSSDPGLDLRIEHTHCFAHYGVGGHYHYDTTPNEVEYEAYYNIAEEVWRIDRPKISHQIGRD